MQSWNPGDRVTHTTYGAGTVLACNERHVVVHFDDHGRRTFASHLVVLKAAPPPGPPPGSRMSRTASERTTDVGYENLNQQTVIRRVDLQVPPAGQRLYVLKCGRCGAEYGATEDDIYLRRCPACMGGEPGRAY